MELGGVLLGAGMVLDIAPKDYLDGDRRVRITLIKVGEIRHEGNTQWVILEGSEKAANGPWRDRRLQVRVKALSRSLDLATA